ncbi:NTP transferase domain-containing protein [Methylobrevis albus]|uniref:Molybdopterin-binding/glycosyltransferase family 2 protein n=1 Tax=Methylobrevis albus TaxID=2793297 RepID=A0A931I1W6_9HYPH|nr:molybdopterin-binding/glycosyltransferase family 2 protein [Methylobrevis albus]MBH0237770.1 molybdopterin-binding/glycosyltransferase family 2 protein [Methylobrevis albus]
MKFGTIPVDGAEGAILAHAAVVPDGVLRKGTRLGPAEIERLRAAGTTEIVAAILEAGDVHEDAAAHRLAAALAGPGIMLERAATGRCNLFADVAGLLKVMPEAVAAVNRVDAGITLATRLPDRGVEAGRMVATVKIIPFSVLEDRLAEAIAAATALGPGLAVRPFRALRVAVVSTLLPQLKATTIAKTLGILAKRLQPAGATIVADRRVPHDAEAVGAALADLASAADLLIVYGASAVVDADDVVPAGIRVAGGAVHHFGMPVDPGNLLLVGEVAGRPVVGAPGCARSPAENGFDFVLERLLAGEPVGREELVGMGVGGLLMDIVTRPAPRGGEASAERPGAPMIGAVVLAAGRSSRMGQGTKMLARLGGVPLVRRAAEAALASRAAHVVVVTGHMGAEVAEALAGLPVTIVENPAYGEGLSASLKVGIAALPAACEAAVVLLGDMPDVSAATVDRLIAAYAPMTGALVAVPVHEGRRGNPVLWSRRFFPALSALEGDVGARHLIAAHGEAVVEVASGPEVLLDLDTPEALAAAGGEPAPVENSGENTGENTGENAG